MLRTRLSGKDWLDAQRVPYQTMAMDSSYSPSQMAEKLKCDPAQVMITELFVNENDSVMVVHSFSKRVNIALLEKHTGMHGLHLATPQECEMRTGIFLNELHPFQENYSWKVLDESIFRNEFVYIRAGEKDEMVKVEANALKYVIGVVNGLLAEVCE